MMQAFPQDNQYIKFTPLYYKYPTLYSYVCQLHKGKEQFLVKLTKYSEHSHVRIVKYMQSGS